MVVRTQVKEAEVEEGSKEKEEERVGERSSGHGGVSEE